MSKYTQPVQQAGTFNISFWGLLTLIFITLKLCHVIDWSWFYVLLPLIVCCTFGALCLLVAWLALAVAAFIAWRISKTK